MRGYTCAQIFTDGHGFVKVYPIKGKGEAHQALMRFIHEVGVPKDLLTDLAPEEMRGEWGEIVRKYKINQKTMEANLPWQNRAEAEIREVKKLVRRALRVNSTPSEFWCYAMEWAARIRSLTAHDSLILGSRTPEERITGRTPDISEYAYFAWSDWVWYREPTTFPDSDIRLGKWLGVADNIGQAMTYRVLTAKGTIIVRSSVTQLSDLDHQNPIIKSQMDEFVKTCFNSRGLGNRGLRGNTSPIEIFPEILDEPAEYTTQEADSFMPESYDEYLLDQVVLLVGGELCRGQLTHRMRDSNGNPIGMRNSNPMMDTREYEVTFPDGSVNSYSANTIAENIYSQVDQEGRNFSLLSEIIDHEEDLNMTKGDLPRHTTREWRLLVAWKDGTTSYIPLREMKNSFPVETAKYAVSNKIDINQHLSGGCRM